MFWCTWKPGRLMKYCLDRPAKVCSSMCPSVEQNLNTRLLPHLQKILEKTVHATTRCGSSNSYWTRTRCWSGSATSVVKSNDTLPASLLYLNTSYYGNETHELATRQNACSALNYSANCDNQIEANKALVLKQRKSILILSEEARRMNRCLWGNVEQI